jgi:hypothetical protein
MNNLDIKIYDSQQHIEELTKYQKEIFSSLHLDCPFTVEFGTPLKKESILEQFKSKIKSKGRPPGSKNKNQVPAVADKTSNESDSKRGRGRPPGSKNKNQAPAVAGKTSNESDSKRCRGRPPGSKNKNQAPAVAGKTSKQSDAN